jgi:hypothetical protein
VTIDEVKTLDRIPVWQIDVLSKVIECHIIELRVPYSENGGSDGESSRIVDPHKGIEVVLERVELHAVA